MRGNRFIGIKMDSRRHAVKREVRARLCLEVKVVRVKHRWNFGENVSGI